MRHSCETETASCIIEIFICRLSYDKWLRGFEFVSIPALYRWCLPVAEGILKYNEFYILCKVSNWLFGFRNVIKKRVTLAKHGNTPYLPNVTAHSEANGFSPGCLLNIKVYPIMEAGKCLQ